MGVVHGTPSVFPQPQVVEVSAYVRGKAAFSAHFIIVTVLIVILTPVGTDVCTRFPPKLCLKQQKFGNNLKCPMH